MPSISRQFALASLVSITVPCFAQTVADRLLIVSCDLSREQYKGIAAFQNAGTGKQEQLPRGQR